MNVRLMVLVAMVMNCSVLRWIIGRETVFKVDVEKTHQEIGHDGKSGESSIPVIHNLLIDSIPKQNNINNVITNDQQIKQAPAAVSKKPITTPNLQQNIRNVISADTKNLKVYIPDGNKWSLDTNVCNANENFQKAWLKTFVGDTPIYIHAPKDDIWISQHLLTTGQWSEGYVNLVFRLLQVENDLQFVDLGANIGVFALSVAMMGRKVIAVEPLSINLQRLCRSVENGVSSDTKSFVDKITIIHNALSDIRESVQLGKDRNNVGGTFVLKKSNKKKVQGSNVMGKYQDVVMTTTLDDLLQLPNFDFKKVILKIDVEGYESKVFNGGHKFFDTVDVRAVLVEWRWHEGAQDIQNLLDFFTQRNYKPFDTARARPSPLQISQAQYWPSDVLWQK